MRAYIPRMRNAKPVALLAALALSACAAQPLPPSAVLPVGALAGGGGDPLRSGVLESAYAFNGGARSPADVARGAAWVEYLAADSKWGGRWADFSPIVRARLDEARGELRQALGIAPEAPPQAVVNGLFLAANTMQAGLPLQNLPALPFADPSAVVQRLQALPALPKTREATALVERDFLRIEQERLIQGGPGGGNGGSSRS